ncbi:ZIP family metal transporter [Adhaeretor mobilis]|nr:ZIP family metal transporter [Adhaeretor mobilis]
MSDPLVPLTYYCTAIIAVSIAGGMIPQWVRLTHAGMQIVVSGVAGVMLGVGLLHMLPHALAEVKDIEGAAHTICLWALGGWLAMFFIERFFCFHHHDVESEPDGTLHEHDDHPHCTHHDHHGHDLTWSGAALGLTLHSVIAGVALAASVCHGHQQFQLAGLGTFMVIVLHKPFDSMTIAMLMGKGGWSRRWQSVVNGLFALAIPVGVALFYFGFAGAEVSIETARRLADAGANAPLTPSPALAYALAFSAGTFLCISMSDLLPELQFHDHDRGKLSTALLVGLVLALGIGKLEELVHRHDAPAAETTPVESGERVENR